MPDIINPYIPGQPVENPDRFFGRRDILGSIREHLVKGRRVFLVSGARRMGKTSLLLQLPIHLPEEFLSVRLDLEAEDGQRLDGLLWVLAERIAQQVSRQLGAEDLEPVRFGFEGHTDHLLEHFWPQVSAALGDRSLVLLLDNIHRLAQPETNLLHALVTFLSVWRDRAENLALVLTASPAWQEALMREHPRLFGGALSYLLGPLASEEAIRLITWPVDGIITYDYGVARRLVEITSGQPYFLQMVCFEVFNRCAAAGWVNQRDVDLVLEDLVSREIADFRRVWDESSSQEQSVLAALASLRGARGIATAQEVRTILSKAGARVMQGQVTASLESLVARGILERLGALSYRFRAALLRDWLSKRINLQEAVRDTRWVSADQPKLSAGRRVSRLRVRQRARKARPTPKQEPAEGTDDRGEEKPALSRSWPWIAVVAILVLAVLATMVASTRWRSSPSVEPTLSAVVLASPTPRPPATVTPRAERATQPIVAVSPTDTQPPLPTATATPTPPLVVARSVPSIAYQSRGAGDTRWAIHTMNSDGTGRVRLTEGQAEFLSAPSWSADGSQIAFVGEVNGTTDIWIMNSDGSDRRQLTNDQAQDHSPACSPDGEWIAFASVRDSPYWELYLMRADGSDLQRLTWWEDASDLWPTWSPDGTRLAFASKRDGNWEIYAMDRDGSNLLRLTNHPADDTSPAWSPDGSRIAFESTREGYAEIYVIPIIGGAATNLSRLNWATDLGPTWSPDGGRLAFYSDRDGEWDVYVMASDGSNAVKLTGDNSNDQVPAWRP